MPRIPVVRYQTPIGSTNGGTVLPMRGPTLPREQFPQRAMNRTQAATRQATRQATSSDDADCTVIRAVNFSNLTVFPIAHGLTDSKGRPRAWVSYRIENVQGAFARFYAVPQGLPLDASSIVIHADAVCVADVRVW